MSLRIAFDLDGVLADMSGELRREADQLGLGSEEVAVQESPASSPDAAPSIARMSDREQGSLWAAVKKIENFWLTLDELEPGSIRRLDGLAVARRWEVLFITTRPATAGETVQRQSQRWLERGGFRLPSVYVVSGSRGKVASALELDIVVDDRPENCIDVKADPQARAAGRRSGSGFVQEPDRPRPQHVGLPESSKYLIRSIDEYVVSRRAKLCDSQGNERVGLLSWTGGLIEMRFVDVGHTFKVNEAWYNLLARALSPMGH